MILFKYRSVIGEGPKEVCLRFTGIINQSLQFTEIIITFMKKIELIYIYIYIYAYNISRQRRILGGGAQYRVKIWTHKNI